MVRTSARAFQHIQLPFQVDQEERTPICFLHAIQSKNHNRYAVARKGSGDPQEGTSPKEAHFADRP